MQSLVPLLLAAAAVCAIPRPPGSSQAPLPTQDQLIRAAPPAAQEYYNDYYLPHMLVPQYMGYDGSPVIPQLSRDDWLNKEIDRITRMKEENEAIGPYEKDLARLIVQDPYLARIFKNPVRSYEEITEIYSDEPVHPQLPPQSAIVAPEADYGLPQTEKKGKIDHNDIKNIADAKENGKDIFALTPLDKGYFDPVEKLDDQPVTVAADEPHEGGKHYSVEIQPQRQIRQNPNLSKTKNLVADHLDRLRTGLSPDDPVSTERPPSIHLMATAATVDPATSIYGIAIIAAVGAALTLAIIGFAFGWYTMSKRAKAAADVDYPAYGVTGPTVDMSGDRKLAQSAHMYHYQHQKQQIIAMERNGMEQRNGSVSDPESEEENEEGDYTVYECPGFATTGDMEVKNPLFSEDPTPATPGKCELVKPQPKD